MKENLTPQTMFHVALDISDESERASYLDQACQGDSALRREVDSLLAAHAATGDFLQPLIDLGSDEPGEKEGDCIGRYKLLEQIGEGGFGSVWMAEQQEPMRRKVALKIIKLGMDTREVLGRFESERQALALMDHPNIAKVFDGGATEIGRPFFVMELVRGVAITEYCDANKLTPSERIDLFRKVCQAVQHAHQKGIIHRDLKPSNILVTVQDDQPVPKIIDFGVAKALQSRLTERTLFTRFRQWVGTPAYMSPEQAGLGSLDVDTRSDVYSLGTILYELLTGYTPFDSQKLREKGYEAVLQTIREEDPPKPSTRLSTLSKDDLHIVADHRGASPGRLDHDIKGELDWILLKALERNRTRRYDTASDLADDLRCYSDGATISAAPPTFAYRTSKFIRRHRRAVVTVASGICLMFVAGAVVRMWYAESPPPPSVPFERTGDPLLATLRGHEAEIISMVYSPSRNMLATSSFDETIKLWDAETGEMLATLRGHESKVWGAAFSPDGNTLASLGFDGKILLWDVEDRALRSVFRENDVPFPDEDPIGAGGKLYFSPDGKTLAVPEGDYKSINFWELESGILTHSINLPGRPWRHAFSPDGMLLAVALSHTNNALTLWEVESGKQIWTRRGDYRDVTALAFSPDGSILATGNADHHVRLWDVASGTVLAQPNQDHISWVWSLAFSPDGKTLATASRESIFLWDVISADRLVTLDGHHSYMSALQFYSDGKTLASASCDCDIKIWDVQSAIDKEQSELTAHIEAAARLKVAATAARKKMPPPVAVDEFEGKLGLDWKVINSDSSHISLAKNPGALTITTQEGGMADSDTGLKNLFLVDNPITNGGDFSVTTYMASFRPQWEWQQAGLLCFDDEDNYLKCIYEISSRMGERIAIVAEVNSARSDMQIPFTPDVGCVWLRITKRGNRYTALYSTDGITFKKFGELQWGDGSPRQLGLLAKNGARTSVPEIDASFDYFEVRKADVKTFARPALLQKEVEK